MAELIILILLIGIPAYFNLAEKREWHNRIPPDGKTLDYARINKDFRDGMNRQTYYRRVNSGYYDIDDDLAHLYKDK